MQITQQGTSRTVIWMLLASILLIFVHISPAQEPAEDTAAPTETTDAEGGAPRVSAPGNVSGAFSSTIEFVTGRLSQQTGSNIVARGKTLGQRVNLIVRDIPLERALDQVVAQKPNWLWHKPEDQPNTYEIWDQESFRTEVLPRNVRQKVFIPREITAEEAHKAITGILTPNIGVASFDPRSNKLIVTDLPYVLELVQRLLEAIDVKFITRVFYIAHADVGEMAEKLSNLKSPAAPAPEVDARTHQIIVRDRLDIIRQMELLVETLDIGPELRIYDLNTLGWDGIGRDEIDELVSQIITPDALYQINVQAGKLLVEDIPEVHEKIEKILAAIDQPPKQVLIQCEIIETSFQEGFNWTIDYTFS
jgi:type II secretory pathway component GspD/PulD (secretin)